MVPIWGGGGANFDPPKFRLGANGSNYDPQNLRQTTFGGANFPIAPQMEKYGGQMDLIMGANGANYGGQNEQIARKMSRRNWGSDSKYGGKWVKWIGAIWGKIWGQLPNMPPKFFKILFGGQIVNMGANGSNGLGNSKIKQTD